MPHAQRVLLSPPLSSFFFLPKNYTALVGQTRQAWICTCLARRMTDGHHSGVPMYDHPPPSALHPSSGTHVPSAVDILSPSEDGGSPSSGNASPLKEQVVELTNRMRYLETLLHDPHHRHRDSRERHLQRPHSFSSARGAVALARTSARGRQRDGTKSAHGGGGGGGTSNSNKRASQDDWANNLSKRSWPPPSGTIDGRRAAMPPHSYGGSSGSLLSPVGEAAAANCVPRWEGLAPNQANRRRRNSGGGGKGATGRSSGGRVGRDNPPGIVLI